MDWMLIVLVAALVVAMGAFGAMAVIMMNGAYL